MRMLSMMCWDQDAGASPSSALRVRAAWRVARAGDPELGPHDGELGRGMALGDAGMELLAGLDDADAGEAAEPALAEALDGWRHAQHQPRVGGRHVERAGSGAAARTCWRAGGRRAGRRSRDGPGRTGERSICDHRPARVGATVTRAAAIGHHPPDLAQHRPHLLGAFDGMDQQHAVDRAGRAAAGRSRRPGR